MATEQTLVGSTCQCRPHLQPRGLGSLRHELWGSGQVAGLVSLLRAGPCPHPQSSHLSHLSSTG